MFGMKQASTPKTGKAMSKNLIFFKLKKKISARLSDRHLTIFDGAIEEVKIWERTRWRGLDSLVDHFSTAFFDNPIPFSFYRV